LQDANLWIENNYDTLIFDSLLLDSKRNGRPLLLYFYGSNNINSRKFNVNALSDSSIVSYIRRSFYPVKLDVVTKVPTTERGRNNFEFQENVFSATIQPFFVIVDLNGTVISRQGYSGSEIQLKESFLKFLTDGLHKCIYKRE
jgi:hypothetical protein